MLPSPCPAGTVWPVLDLTSLTWMWVVYGLSDCQFSKGRSPTCTKLPKSKAQRSFGELTLFHEVEANAAGQYRQTRLFLLVHERDGMICQVGDLFVEAVDHFIAKRIERAFPFAAGRVIAEDPDASAGWKNSAISTASLNRSKCSLHGLSIATFPIGEPMLMTPRPLAASLVLISFRSRAARIP